MIVTYFDAMPHPPADGRVIDPAGKHIDSRRYAEIMEGFRPPRDSHQIAKAIQLGSRIRVLITFVPRNDERRVICGQPIILLGNLGEKGQSPRSGCRLSRSA